MPYHPEKVTMKTLSITKLATASALSLLTVVAFAEDYSPADTYVEQYVGDYPLAVTESVGTFSDSETAKYPEAVTFSSDGSSTSGYETAATESDEPQDAFYSENVRNDGPVVTVPAAYSTDDVPIFVNNSVASDVALDNSVVSGYDAPNGYFAQFGAFGVLDNAQRLRSKLVSQLGSSVLVVEEDGLYKVQAGPFENSDRAFATQTSSSEKIRVIRR